MFIIYYTQLIQDYGLSWHGSHETNIDQPWQGTPPALPGRHCSCLRKSPSLPRNLHQSPGIPGIPAWRGLKGLTRPDLFFLHSVHLGALAILARPMDQKFQC